MTIGGAQNDVKGGLVIEQLKRYAKRLSVHTGGSVNIRIDVWFRPDSTTSQEDYSIDFIVWDAAKSRFVELPYKISDLRGVGKLIDDLIASGSAKEKLTGHMGE